MSQRRGSVATGIVETKRDSAAPGNQIKQGGIDRTLADSDFKEMPKEEAKKVM